MWYRNKVVMTDGKETIYEIIFAEDGLGVGLAIAEIHESRPHHHNETRETYLLISGELEVFIGDTMHLLAERGQSIEIPLRTRHWARSRGDGPARILVSTVPAWTPEDHILEG